MRRAGFLLAFFAFLVCPSLYAQNSCNGMSLGRGASLNGFIPFPADNAWNQNISNASVDPNSDAIINFIGGDTPLHPDFGAGLYDGSTIGIPYDVVSGSPFVNIHFTAYGSESDPGPMPIPHNAPIEGYPHPATGTATSWCSIATTAGFTSSTILLRRATEVGKPIQQQYGIC